MSSVLKHSRTRPQGRVFASVTRQTGYTVVELVIVMVLMGILAVNAMPRFFEASRFDEMGYADTLEGALRYAQKLALASRCEIRVEIDADGYALFRREREAGDPPAPACPTGDFSVAVVRPGGQTWVGETPPGVGVGALDVYFDAWGSPYDVATDMPHAGVPLAVGTRILLLEPESGYVHSG